MDVGSERLVERTDPGPLRLHQLPQLFLAGPGVAARASSGADLPVVEGLAPRVVRHEVGGCARRPRAVHGLRLALSDGGLDRAAGLVALGADHGHGCLGASGLSLGDASRYAARLERLGLRAERVWPDLAEGYYVLDAEPWNLRRLVVAHVVRAAESFLQTLPPPDDGAPAAALVLLGPTCTTVG